MFLYFIFGIIFAIVIFPLLDAFVILASTWIETLKGKLGVKLTIYQKQIDEIYPEEKEEKTPAIGFVYPEEETEDDYGDYDE